METSRPFARAANLAARAGRATDPWESRLLLDEANEELARVNAALHPIKGEETRKILINLEGTYYGWQEIR